MRNDIHHIDCSQPLNLPHCPPIRMIDALDSADERFFASHVVVPAESPYVLDGQLCPEMLLEVMAQCFAAGLACLHQHGAKKEGSAPSWGYLAAIRDFKVEAKIHSGDILSARCEIAMKVNSLWVVNGHVERDNKEMASAQFKIYVPEE